MKTKEGGGKPVRLACEQTVVTSSLVAVPPRPLCGTRWPLRGAGGFGRSCRDPRFWHIP